MRFGLSRRLRQQRVAVSWKHKENRSYGGDGVLTSANVPGERYAKITVRTEQPGISFPTTWLEARRIAGAKMD